MAIGCLVFFNKIISQTPSFFNYETSNGLPSNEIYDIAQDSKGFLWLGTEAGLVKYDGARFINYTSKASRGNAVSNIKQDVLGTIWCTNFNGQIFYLKEDSLCLFTPFEPYYKTNYAEIEFDENNDLIITCGTNCYYRYVFKENKIYIYNNTRNQTYVAPFKLSNKQVVITDLGNKTQLYSIDGKKNIEFENVNKIKHFNNFIISNSYKSKKIYCFQNFNKTNPIPLLYHFFDGKMLLHPISILLQKTNAYPQSVYDDDDGNLFIGTTQKLFWFKILPNNTYVLFNTMLLGNSISSIKKDTENNIWIGTLKNGLYKIPNTQIFTLTNLSATGVNHLTTNNTNTVYGSYLNGNFFVWNRSLNTNTNIKSNQKRDAQFLKFNHYTQELFLTQNETNIYNSNGAFKQNILQSLTNSKDLFFTKEGVIYKASNYLEILFDRKKNDLRKKLLQEYDTIDRDYFKNNIIDFYDKIVIREQRCKAVCFDELNQTLWCAYIDGLFNYKKKEIKELLQPITNKSIIANKILYDSINQRIIVSTVNQGFFIIKNSKIIQEINTNNGLESNEIRSFIYNNNNLWFISKGKVCNYNLTTKKVKFINQQDGLLTNELYDIEFLCDTIFVASSKGVQYFPKQINTYNNISPSIFIKQFNADDSIYNINNEIELKATTKNITIHLIGVALKSDGKLKFQYRLLPTDSSWITTEVGEDIIRYSSLASNNYFFECKAINEDGVDSKMILKIKFTINKPWYLQWWFFMFCLVFVGFCTYLIYSYRSKKNQQKLVDDLAKSKIEEELRKSQLTSLKAQMNPHFLFNALNSIQEFIILNDKQQANIFMGKFADLMRLTLDMSNKNEVVLEDEIKSIKLYLELEALRFEEQFAYEIVVDESVAVTEIYMPPMLVQPYIENAVKHGLLHKKGDKKLSVSFSLKDSQTLNCKIFDNGIGRKRSSEINQQRQKKHTSFATGATQIRLDLLNIKRKDSISVIFFDLKDETGNATGTEVIINIPI